MDSKTYEIEASKTLCINYAKTRERFQDCKMIDAYHGAIGICTESGELLDAYKKYLWYGKKLDLPNILEEVGDLLFYVNAVLKAHNFTFEQAMDINIKKLRKRYGESFSEEKSLKRDLKEERKILESSHSQR